MLSSITPLGERGRASRWGVTVTAYLIGSLVAGAALGALLGALGGLGPAGPPLRPALLASACLAGAVADARGARPNRPRRQVNEDWLTRYRGWVYGVAFGAQLGLGVVTIITTGAVLVTWVAAALTGSAAAGALIGAAFGLARALPVVAMYRVRYPDALRRAFSQLEAARRPAVRLVVGAQAWVGVAALVVAGWWT